MNVHRYLVHWIYTVLTLAMLYKVFIINFGMDSVIIRRRWQPRGINIQGFLLAYFLTTLI